MKAKILHRDISLMNMMIDNTDAEYPRPGVLIDYDFAQDMDKKRREGKTAPLAPENAGLATAPQGSPQSTDMKSQETHRTVRHLMTFCSFYGLISLDRALLLLCPGNSF